jgi:pimeloyl-ACP methyl ester carboxylesterase
MVTVEKDVQLEVLDWGGSGPALVLLAGFGNTAHVFDGFAPKLIGDRHVYGITRRGYGASSVPAGGYNADRLGDDVVAVLDSLKLDRPVLVGHSIAGQELSSIATRFPGRIAGVVFLEAAYRYAFDPPDLWEKLGVLDDNIHKLQQRPSSPTELKSLLEQMLGQDLPEVRQELEALLALQTGMPPVPPPQAPPPTITDLTSFQALQSYYTRVLGYTPPEAELRQCCTDGQGPNGIRRTPTSVAQGIRTGGKKYRDIRVPALAIYALPRDFGPFAGGISSPLAGIDSAATKSMANAFATGVPGSKVIALAGAHHYLFLTNEREVISAIREFVSGLVP